MNYGFGQKGFLIEFNSNDAFNFVNQIIHLNLLQLDLFNVHIQML